MRRKREEEERKRGSERYIWIQCLSGSLVILWKVLGRSIEGMIFFILRSSSGTGINPEYLSPAISCPWRRSRPFPFSISLSRSLHLYLPLSLSLSLSPSLYSTSWFLSTFTPPPSSLSLSFSLSLSLSLSHSLFASLILVFLFALRQSSVTAGCSQSSVNSSQMDFPSPNRIEIEAGRAVFEVCLNTAPT